MTPYDVQTNGTQAGSIYWIAFNVATSLLEPGYEIHFDLYNKNGTITINLNIGGGYFAPISHDAESLRKVPEPSSLVLLGFGLMGVAMFRRKKQ